MRMAGGEPKLPGSVSVSLAARPGSALAVPAGDSFSASFTTRVLAGRCRILETFIVNQFRPRAPLMHPTIHHRTP